MPIAEIVIVRHEDGAVRSHLTHHATAPWFGRIMLTGPESAVSTFAALPEGVLEIPATSVVVIDIPNKRALYDAPTAFLDPEDHDDVHRAADAIITGLWACFGWEVRFRNQLHPSMPTPWPAANRPPCIQSSEVRALLRHLGDWSPVPRHLPTRAQLGPLANLSVRVERGIPVAGAVGDVRDPRKLALAAGIGVAAGYLNADLEIVRPSSPWVKGADPSLRAQLDWNRVVEHPQEFAASLAGVNGLSASENLENLEASVEDELRNRDLLKVDVWHLLDRCDPDTRREIATKVRRMFETAGMV